MSITIPKEARKLARSYSDKVGRTATLRHRNYTGLVTEDRYFIGFLGEWAFKTWLEKTGSDYHWEPKSDGKSDDQDFLAWYAGGKRRQIRIDVKTSQDRTRLLVNQAQLRKMKSQVIVSCHYGKRENVVTLRGWVVKTELSHYPVDKTLASPAITVPSHLLHPMEMLSLKKAVDRPQMLT